MDHPRSAYQRRTIVKRSATAAAQIPLGLGLVAVTDSRPVPTRQPDNHQPHNHPPRDRRRLCLKIDSDSGSGSDSGSNIGSNSGSNSGSYNGSGDSDNDGSDGGSNSGNPGNNLEGPGESGLNIRELIKEYSVKGPTAAAHGPSTKQGLLRHRERWLQFAKEAGLDPHHTLVHPDPAVFKAYLRWLVTRPRSRIKKDSTIKSYWNCICMLFAVDTGKWMTDEILRDVRNWINSDLTPSLGLDKSQKDKSGLYVDDLDRVLYHLWVDDRQVMTHERLRAQVALILIVAAATSTRPNALIGKVLYRHVEFQIFRPAKGSTSARIGLVWDLQHVKKRRPGPA